MNRNEYVVLLYHGVHPDDLDVGFRNSSGKHIPRSLFAEQMRFIAEHCTVVPMSQIAAAHRGETSLPKRAVAVTFDDGLLNNYSEAWPVLEGLEIPATFYLATGFIGTGRIIWSDALEDALLRSEESEIRFAAESRTYSFRMDQPSSCVAALQQIKRLCKASSEATREKIVSSIVERVPGSDSQHPLYAFMDWDHVIEMDASHLVEFGAHTVDHVSLGKVPRPAMEDQVDRSCEALSSVLGRRCEFFSYPEGQADDFDDAVIACLRNRGFDHAPTAIDGLNVVGETDPFHIRRCMVGFEGRRFPIGERNTGEKDLV